VLRIFQDIVLVAHNPQENCVFHDFKGQPIKIIDPHFPNIFFAFDLFRMKGWMFEVCGKLSDLSINLVLDCYR